MRRRGGPLKGGGVRRDNWGIKTKTDQEGKRGRFIIKKKKKSLSEIKNPHHARPVTRAQQTALMWRRRGTACLKHAEVLAQC